MLFDQHLLDQTDAFNSHTPSSLFLCYTWSPRPPKKTSEVLTPYVNEGVLTLPCRITLPLIATLHGVGFIYLFDPFLKY